LSQVIEVGDIFICIHCYKISLWFSCDPICCGLVASLSIINICSCSCSV